ncbi:hypothetical protein ACOY6S_12870 [Enterobacter bugandensis]|uniref:hypothetical protein n=1 Tax=Enterobacter bugandensis TaxID=881260 RepID=UPI003BC9C38B
MLLPEKLAYVHSAISAVFTLALLHHYRSGDKDPSIKSRLLISILSGMSIIGLAVGIFWPDYH